MSDIELLELAAKAAGMDVSRIGIISGLYVGDDGWWNPLERDGDALRLAVKLSIGVEISPDSHWRPYSSALVKYMDKTKEATYLHGSDKYAATRMAIVRAAAEIGKEMK